MKAIALGINGFGYSVFADCSVPFMNSLFMSFPRGVVENRERLDAKSAWEVITEGLEGKVTLANIPVAEITAGVVSLPASISEPELEMGEILKAFSKVNEGIMLASVNSYDNIIRSGAGDRCAAAGTIDAYVRKLYELSDSFMLFSPFGEVLEGKRDVYGIYISTVPRPREDETVKLHELPGLIMMLLEAP